MTARAKHWITVWGPTILWLVTVGAGGVYISADVDHNQRAIKKLEDADASFDIRIRKNEQAVAGITGTITEGFRSMNQSIDRLIGQIDSIGRRLDTTSKTLDDKIEHVSNQIKVARIMKSPKENQQ